MAKKEPQIKQESKQQMDWKDALNEIHKKYMASTEAKGIGTLQGLKSMVTPPPQPMNMAMGGMTPAIEPNMTPANPIFDLSAQLAKTPDTNYDFYRDISAEDRAALAKKLLVDQASAGSLAGNAVAGLGDAIARSFGGQNTSFQKDYMAGQDENRKERLAAFDTQRTQREQDINNNPNHPLAQQARALFNKMGIPVPEGLSFGVMAKLAPSLGDLVKGNYENELKKQELEATNAYRKAELAQQSATLEETKRQHSNEETNKEEDLKAKNLEQLGKMGPISRFLHPEETKALKEGAGLGSPMKGNGWSIKKRG